MKKHKFISLLNTDKQLLLPLNYYLLLGKEDTLSLKEPITLCRSISLNSMGFKTYPFYKPISKY